MKRVLIMLVISIGIISSATSQCDLKLKEQLIAKSKADSFNYIKDFSFEFDAYTKSKFCNLVLQRNTIFRIYLGSSSTENPEIEFSLLNKKVELKKLKLRNEIISFDFQPDSSGIFELNLKSLNNDKVCVTMLLAFKRLPPPLSKIKPVKQVPNINGPAYLVTDEMPEFVVGGDKNAFYNWIKANFKMPEIVNKKNLKGSVIVNFIVDTHGNVTEAKVIKGIDPDVDASVINFFKTCPKWEKPGKLKGENVRTILALPVYIKPDL